MPRPPASHCTIMDALREKEDGPGHSPNDTPEQFSGHSSSLDGVLESQTGKETRKLTGVRVCLTQTPNTCHPCTDDSVVPL